MKDPKAPILVEAHDWNSAANTAASQWMLKRFMSEPIHMKVHELKPVCFVGAQKSMGVVVLDDEFVPFDPKVHDA